MSQWKHVFAEWAPLWMRMGGRRIYFVGNEHKCIMCNAMVRKFLQNGTGFPILEQRQVVGGMPRSEDRRPVCHTLDGMRLVRLYLETETPIESEPLSVLHVAPDLSLVLWFKRLPHLDYTATDLSARRYRHVLNFTPADLTDLPFPDRRFDIAICSHVLEHVPDDRKAMKELYRVTKPGGTVLALTPLATDDRPTEEDLNTSDPRERERRFGQWDHMRLYHRDDFAARLRGAGFDVNLWDAFAEHPARAKGWHLNPLEFLPVSKRPLV